MLSCVHFSIENVPCSTRMRHATRVTSITRKWLDTEWQQPFTTLQRTWLRSLESDWTLNDDNHARSTSKFTDPLTPSHSRFSYLLLAIWIKYNVSWYVNPFFPLTKTSFSMVRGMASVCKSNHFLLSNIGSVCNSSITSAIKRVGRLGRLKR